MLLCFLYIRVTRWPSTETDDISHLSTIKRQHIRKEKYVLKWGHINGKKVYQIWPALRRKYTWKLKTKIIHACTRSVLSPVLLSSSLTYPLTCLLFSIHWCNHTRGENEWQILPMPDIPRADYQKKTTIQLGRCHVWAQSTDFSEEPLPPSSIRMIKVGISSHKTGNHEVKELQKTAILGTAHILRKVLM